MLAGLARVIEVCFVQPTNNADSEGTTLSNKYYKPYEQTIRAESYLVVARKEKAKNTSSTHWH
jgi:hypothetical protein